MDEQTQPADVTAYLDHLRRGLQVRRRWGRLFAWSLGCAGAVALLGLVGELLAGEMEALLVLLLRTPCGQVSLLLLVAAGYLAVRRAAASREARQAAGALAVRDDVRLLPDLIEAWSAGDTKTGRACRVGLLRLLPSLRPSQTDLLDEPHRVLLRDVFYGRDVELASVVLKALEQVGTDEDVWFAESLAEPEQWTPALPLAWNARVRAAARECLPALRVRAQEQRERRCLLRPAAAPGEAEEGLLRPAPPAPGEPPEELLRPAEGPAAQGGSR